MTPREPDPWPIIEWLAENMPRALELCPYKVNGIGVRAADDAWACLACEATFPEEAARPGRLQVIGRCPMCGSLNVRTPVGRVREATKP